MAQARNTFLASFEAKYNHILAYGSQGEVTPVTSMSGL